MEDSFPAEAAKTGMAMDNIDLLANDDIAEDRKERKNGWKGSFSVDDEEWDVVDLQAIREITDPSPAFVCMCDNYHFVSAVDEFLKRAEVRLFSSNCAEQSA